MNTKLVSDPHTVPQRRENIRREENPASVLIICKSTCVHVVLHIISPLTIILKGCREDVRKLYAKYM